MTRKRKPYKTFTNKKGQYPLIDDLLRKNQKMKVKYNNLTIEITNEPDLDLSNISQKFNKQYPSELGQKLEYQPSSMHGIRISENGTEKCSAILLESGGATGITENSFVIKNESIYICCSDMVYCLKLSDLSVNWRNQCDPGTCFQIYEFEDDFIIHGEMQISRIDEQGKTKWNFGARDIFVSPDGKNELKIIENRIEVIDWQGYKYVLNSAGELLSEEKVI